MLLAFDAPNDQRCSSEQYCVETATGGWTDLGNISVKIQLFSGIFFGAPLYVISHGSKKRRDVETLVHTSLESSTMATGMTEKHTGTSEELLQLVSFTIGGEEFGVDILQVQEINRMLEVTHVPNAPEFVDGVINLRGKVIPIIDLRRRFGMPRKEHDKSTRIVVVELHGQVVGFVVDAVSEVLRIPRSVTEPPPSIVGGIHEEYILSLIHI